MSMQELVARAITAADPKAPAPDAPVLIGMRTAPAWQARIPMADAAISVMECKLRGYAAVALDNPKSGENVGGAMRAANCYGASLIVLGGERPDKFMGHPTDTMKTYRHKPVLRVADVFDALPFDCVPVAVDLIEGATPLPEYQHPERAFYIFGAEDATLGARITSRCRDIVVVPTTLCMNLAATVNVVLYDRLSKQVLS